MPVNGERLEAAHFSDLFRVADIEGLEGELAGKAGVVHGHAIADVVGLEVELGAKAPALHNHTIAQVTGLQAALDLKADLLALSAKPDAFYELADVAISEPLNHVGEFLAIGQAGEIISASGGEASSLSAGQELEVKRISLRILYPNDATIWDTPGNYTFECPGSLDFPVTLVVVGGGKGGGQGAGTYDHDVGGPGQGGGPGEAIVKSVTLIPGVNYTVTVGAGGAGGVSAQQSAGVAGSDGEASSFGADTAAGGTTGGAGGLWEVPPVYEWQAGDGGPAPLYAGSAGAGGRGAPSRALPPPNQPGLAGENGAGGFVALFWDT